MIIESSAVKMNAQRTFHSSSALGGSGRLRFISSGKFVSTAVSVAQKHSLNRDLAEEQKQTGYSDSTDDLMARFSQSRSIRATHLESSRSLRSMHIIRSRSIGYMLHQMFWGRRGQTIDPISALLTDYNNSITGNNLFLNSGNQSHFEAERTKFSAEGKVVTASGREISFHVGVQMSRSFYEETKSMINVGALTDPLVINLDSEPTTVSDQKFYFDLDADGHQEQISKLNAGSGFLALDRNGDGIINDGSELFGTSSGNGFADLAQYDQDGNGWIDEADEIFDKLLIWQKDEKGNDVLRGLGAAGVGAIYLGNVNTEFSLNSEVDNQTNAVVRQTGMFLYENGESGTIQQIDLAR